MSIVAARVGCPRHLGCVRHVFVVGQGQGVDVGAKSDQRAICIGGDIACQPQLGQFDLDGQMGHVQPGGDRRGDLVLLLAQFQVHMELAPEGDRLLGVLSEQGRVGSCRERRCFSRPRVEGRCAGSGSSGTRLLLPQVVGGVGLELVDQAVDHVDGRSTNTVDHPPLALIVFTPWSRWGDAGQLIATPQAGGNGLEVLKERRDGVAEDLAAICARRSRSLRRAHRGRPPFVQTKDPAGRRCVGWPD